MEPLPWRFVAASVVGSSHLKTNLPCQDAHAYALIDGAQPVLALIASDGAGSAKYSQFGARIACEGLLQCVRGYVENGGQVGNLARATLEQWLDEVASAIDAAAQNEGVDSREYACTVLAAFISQTEAAFVQIGDGAMVVHPEGDEWCYVFWPQHGEYINTTLFLTDPVARSNFLFDVSNQRVDEIALFTDGLESLLLHYATKSVHQPFFDSMFPAVRSMEIAGFSGRLSEKLSSYLESKAICDRTDDDKTLLLASRRSSPPTSSSNDAA